MFGPDQWKAAYQNGITDLKAIIREDAPKGKRRQDIEDRVKRIEGDLAKADAAFAQTVGFPICHCKLPGIPMLWKEPELAHVCPECGHRRRGAGGPVKVGTTSRDRREARRAHGVDFDVFTGE